MHMLCRGGRRNPCACVTFGSTLVIGGAGSLMLDIYGWESVFYVSGLLAVMWAYCMWKYLLKGEGKWGFFLSYLWCLVSFLIGWNEFNAPSYANLPVFFCTRRANHHSGVLGKWCSTVQIDQKALVTALQTTGSLVRTWEKKSCRENICSSWTTASLVRLSESTAKLGSAPEMAATSSS